MIDLTENIEQRVLVTCYKSIDKYIQWRDGNLIFKKGNEYWLKTETGIGFCESCWVTDHNDFGYRFALETHDFRSTSVLRMFTDYFIDPNVKERDDKINKVLEDG
tara:strand:+ start:83888 stop:84202 length:315 start_codon:yes stop_codon:yes gene_type:complete